MNIQQERRATMEDFIQGKAEILAFAGKIHPALKEVIYVSSDPKVFPLQLRCWALAVSLRREGLVASK